MQTWMNGLFLLCLIAGQAEILVAIVNRSYSLPVQSELLRRFRRLHDLLMVVFPVVLVGWVGFHRPGVLLGGSWSELNWPWLIACSVCAVGTCSLVAGALRWQLRSPPDCRTVMTSEVLDLREEHGSDIIGDGLYRGLTKVPGNQFLQLEIVERTYNAAALGGQEISILHLTDFHFTGIPGRVFYESAIESAMQRDYDMVVFTGDLLDDPRLLAWFPTTLGRLSARLGCYYILGNHDWSIGDSETRTMFDDHGWTNVASRATSVPDTELVIGGSECPWMGQHPNFDAVDDAANDATRILLSHSPDNLAWARANNVSLMLSGHNHGGQVILPVIGPVYSPSRYGVRYSGGDFFHEPTLLHVCRGIGARHPLRLNCRPEITILSFRNPQASS